MPLFSVIIPAYNRAALIGQTLDSVLDQSGLAAQEREIIVVDDGSTDETVEVVKRYAEHGVRVLQQRNLGPGAARNVGLRSAGGEYVAFLDSDDLWFAWTAGTYRRVIEQHGQPGFIAGKPLVFEPGEKHFPERAEELKTLEFSDYYASGDEWRWYSASSFVMRRDALLAAGGFTDAWVNGEDAHAAMRMGIAGKFVQIISPCTFAYRRHAGSAMSNQMRSVAGIRLLIDDEKTGRFPGGEARASERRRIITTFARASAMTQLAEGNRKAGWEIYRRTFKWHLGLARWKFLAGFFWRAVTTRLGAGK